jgi:hypothetical protein
MLTKSDVLAVLQCPRMLWLQQHRPDLVAPESASLDRRAMDGAIVGERARLDLEGGYIWPEGQADKHLAAAHAHKALRQNPGRPGVEVPAVHADLYARADALIPVEDGFVLRETKAATFPLKKDKVTPDKPDEHHLDDVAVQAWVLEGAGFAVQRAELNLLDNQWRYPGNGDYRGLFRQLDATGAVRERMARVPLWLVQAREVSGATDMPKAAVGAQCKKPFDCAYQDFCKALEPPAVEHPLSLLPDKAGKDLARKLADTRGYVSLLEPSPEELVGKQAPLYLRMQRAHRTGQAILEPGARVLMQGLSYPRYYFDFEGIDLPVPRWAGVRPYEQVPFQWSCHVERSPGVFEHHAFLDLTGDDPSLACIERMLEVIDPADNGPLLVYYQPYEKGRLEELALRHPEHAEALSRYIERLVDLHPWVKQHYYHPRMKGSFSIKKVLPVIAPDLDYAELDEVQEGTGAQVAYLFACFDPGTTPEQKRKLRRGLLAYCEQDTWAMVEVGYFLEGLARPLALRPAGADETSPGVR